MGEHTHIEWTDHSFAPWFGCTKVSDGAKGACTGCYAEHLTVTRFGKAAWGPHAERVRSAASTWKQPLAWNRKAEREGARPFVFCSHLSDVFDNQVPPAWRTDLFELILRTPHLVWLLLTKRPQNIERMYGACFDMAWPRNAAIGCTVVTQAEADRDVLHLLRAKAALRPAFAFLSMEPLMEAVDLRALRMGDNLTLDALTGFWSGSATFEGGFANAQAALKTLPTLPEILPPVDWVITGGETDQGAHKARPVRVEWIRALRDQCAAVGADFNFKQWGSWHADALAYTDMQGNCPPPNMKIGHKRAGRLLDGVTHDARPAVGDGFDLDHFNRTHGLGQGGAP